ncbi:MAG: putative flap endonuclease 1-like [Terrestrivirus sp.]|uniref:Putative flap endonuclease 1-like n=1 Tax=Terrestrivirus sp. TaxID=2487775 RepID=A0A3G4ZMJ6_9VIRU|nr:MAG: putative flap endonuclease 1-like [Terrestrivirus sp.]
MGVRKLYKFLSEKKLIKEYPNLTRYVNSRKRDKIQHMINSESIIVAIDFWLYAHKFTYSYGNMIIGFWNQIIKLLSHKIIPLYIFDGRPPQEKDAVIQLRHQKRQNMENKLKDIYDELTDEQTVSNNSESIKDVDTNSEHYNTTETINDLEKEKNRLEKSIIYIKKNDIDIIKQFFDILSIPYLDATGEADALCAKLFKEGYITSCLSDDMDMLALGCRKTIKFLDGKVLEFDLSYILKELELSYEQFVEMCTLFGCDYIKPSFRLQPDESYTLIKEYGSIENILNEANHPIFNRENEKCINFIKGYTNAKYLLINSHSSETIPKQFKPCIINEIDPFIVMKYLKIYGQINFVIDDNFMQRIITSIEYVNNYISRKYLR